MAAGIKTRIKLPPLASRGSVVTIKTQITHIMENGHRRDGNGVLIPRAIIHRFTCDFEGENIVDLKMGPSISTNPFFEFDARLPNDSPSNSLFEFKWYDDDGSIYRDARTILIT